MKTNTKRRAYGELRDIIERRGGTMTYRRQGYRHGAWVIALDSKQVIIKAMGCSSFPALDRLYVPKCESPTTWNDYRNELVADAEKQLCAFVRSTGR